MPTERCEGRLHTTYLGTGICGSGRAFWTPLEADAFSNLMMVGCRVVVATAEGDETTGRMALRTRGCCGSPTAAGEGLGDPPGNLTALTELALTEGVRVPRDGGVGVVGRVTRVLVGEGEGEGDTVLVPPAD